MSRHGEIKMARKKVSLSSEQKEQNSEILDRLEEERLRLIEETRALQEQTKRKPGRKKKNQPTSSTEDI
jgi:hypothetical protein